METKSVNLTTLSFSQAVVLKHKLLALGIECNLEEISDKVSEDRTVKVLISQANVEAAHIILDEMNKRLKHTEPIVTPPPSTLKRLLVPVDFSESSEFTALYAVSMANHLKAEIRLLHVFYLPIVNAISTEVYATDMSGTMMEIENEARNKMKDFEHSIREHMKEEGNENIKITSECFSGIAEDVILEVANIYNPDLIIMGTYSKRAGSKHGLGGVAASVVERSVVPVLAVPPQATLHTDAQTHSIAFATNFEESDFEGLNYMAHLAYSLNAQLHCIHYDNYEKHIWNDIRMKGLTQYMREKYSLETICTVVKGPDFFTAVDFYLKSKKIEILAMTTHKRTLLARLFKPSISNNMAADEDMPILMFKASAS